MIDAAILRAMVSAGATAEMVVAAIAADQFIDAERAAAKREANRIRKQNQRARHADNAGHRVTERDTPSPSPAPSSSPPTPSLITTPPSSPSPGSLRSPSVAAFDEFWRRYPHKVGKQAAERAFEKVRKSGKVESGCLLDGLERYVRKTDDRPWCNPATWLNEGRWDDAPAAPITRMQALPRPGSREDRQEKTQNAIEKLNDFIHSGGAAADRFADDEDRGGDAREAAFGRLPFAKPA